jgi:hypothetical protein
LEENRISISPSGKVVDAKIDFIIPFSYEAICQVRKVNPKIIWNPKLISVSKIGNRNRSNDIVG